MTEHGAPREHDVRVLEVLLVDEKREVTKDEARRRWALPERRFRAAISELRLRGVPIWSESAEGSTYRLCRTEAEVDQVVAELESRAMELLKRTKAMREAKARYFGIAEQIALIPAGRR